MDILNKLDYFCRQAPGAHIRLVPITEAELNDRSNGLDGRYGWLSPTKTFDGEKVWFDTPVCPDVLDQQVIGLPEDKLNIYLHAISYWMHSHASQMLAGNTDFLSREAQIESELYDTSPGFVRTVSEVQMRMLDAKG